MLKCPGNPWLTTNGSYLMINSDDGGLYLNNYTSQPIYHYGGGTTYLYDSTKNHLIFRDGSGDSGLPATTTRSVGTKVVLAPTVDADSVDLAIGTYGEEMWFSAPNFSTSHAFRFYFGTDQAFSLGRGGNANIEAYLRGRSSLTGTDTGSVIIVDRSTGTNNVPGMFAGVQADGGYSFLWPDDAGDWRTAAAFPEADGTPAQNSGTVVGTQSSSRASKNILGRYTYDDGALALMLRTPVYRFTYKNGRMNGEEFVGIVTDDSPEFGMDGGRSFNPINALGYTIGAFKAQQAEIERLRKLSQLHNSAITALDDRLARVEGIIR